MERTPNGFYKDRTDDQLVDYTKQHFNGRNPKYLQKNAYGLYHQLRIRNLFPVLEEEGVIIRYRRNFARESDEGLIEQVKEKYSGKSPKEVQNNDNGLYQVLVERDLIGDLVESDVLVRRQRNFRSMNDEQLSSHIKDNYKGKSPTELKNEDDSLYQVLVRRDLIKKLVENRILKRKIRNFNQVSNEELLEYVRDNYEGRNIVEFREVDGSLYGVLKRKGLIDKLVNMKVLKRKKRKYGLFDEMNNDELMDYTKRFHNGQSPSKILEENQILYGRLMQCNLIDVLVDNGIIVRKRHHNPYRDVNDALRCAEDLMENLGLSELPTEKK
ncbi:hypothetical protein CMI37_37710, partial [Candidatus Pacearchaeota archaeon]|nr:hypothetical protein [Candidatus Pacearchaeota archaeon]